MKVFQSKKALLIAAGATLVAIAAPSSYLLLKDNPKPVKHTSASTQSVGKTETQVSSQPDTLTPAATTTQPTADPQTQTADPAPTNPYPEGFNIWHDWNRRTELGLTTPSSNPSDQTYWQGVTSYITNTPSQYAIIFNSRNSVIGLVESINADNSLTISCTACRGGWNKLTTWQLPAIEVRSYQFIQ